MKKLKISWRKAEVLAFRLQSCAGDGRIWTVTHNWASSLSLSLRFTALALTEAFVALATLDAAGGGRSFCGGL